MEGHYLEVGSHKESTIYNMTESPDPMFFPGQTRTGKENGTTQLQLSFNPQNIIQVNGTDSQMATDIARIVLRANGNIPGGEIT